MENVSRLEDQRKANEAKPIADYLLWRLRKKGNEDFLLEMLRAFCTLDGCGGHRYKRLKVGGMTVPREALEQVFAMNEAYWWNLVEGLFRLLEAEYTRKYGPDSMNWPWLTEHGEKHEEPDETPPADVVPLKVNGKPKD